MTQRASRKRGRTPLDDAPPYDPSEWNTSELSFIESFSRRVAEEQLRRREGQENAARPSSTRTARTSAVLDPSETVTSFHSLPLFRPQSVFARLFNYFFPDRYRRYQGNLSDRALQNLANDELLTLMQLAMAAGERDRTGVIARELSRRRLHVGVTTATPGSRRDAPNTDAGLFRTSPGPSDAQDDGVLLWVAGEGTQARASGATTGTQGTHTSSATSRRRPLARYEGDAPSRGRRGARPSWWNLFRGTHRADDSEEDGHNAKSATRRAGRAGARRAPEVAPEPPSFLRAAPTCEAPAEPMPHGPYTGSAAGGGIDDHDGLLRAGAHMAADTRARETSPLNPGPVPARYLSEAAQRGGGGSRLAMVADATAGEATRPGQLRPSRRVPLSEGDVGGAEIWHQQPRPPLARHAGRQSTAAPRSYRSGSPSAPAAASAPTPPPWHTSATSDSGSTGNNWWNIKGQVNTAFTEL